jgi:hypothetical protein
MNITIDWQEPVQLTQGRKITIDANDLPEEIEDVPGVYFFSRKFGEKYTPFYIGETLTLRQRLKTHLGTKRLADTLRGIEHDGVVIEQGTRFFHYGYFRSKSNQVPKKCIQIVQKYLIREALAQNVFLLNKTLTTFKVHTITFLGSYRARAIYKESASVEAIKSPS